MAILTGVSTGFLSVLFRTMLEHSGDFVKAVSIWLQDNVHNYSVAIIPIVGAVILVILMRIFPFVVGGYSMPNFLKSIHLQGGLIKTREIFAKMATTTITITSGGSVGVEGPIAQIGGELDGTAESTGQYYNHLKLFAMNILIKIWCKSNSIAWE